MSECQKESTCFSATNLNSINIWLSCDKSLCECRLWLTIYRDGPTHVFSHFLAVCPFPSHTT